MTDVDVYEIRLRFDTADKWSDAMDIAQRLEAQIAKFANHTNTTIDWYQRVDDVLGAPHLILRAPADFVTKIEQFPEVDKIHPAPYATRPRGEDAPEVKEEVVVAPRKLPRNTFKPR